MQKNYDITDAELEIMQVLWEKECDLNEIVKKLSAKTPRNKNTVKTLLRRLILKGSIESKKSNAKNTVYIPKVNKENFLNNQNESFLKKLYNGSINKLLLNFVENKKISKEELEKLIDILEEGEK